MSDSTITELGTGPAAQTAAEPVAQRARRAAATSAVKDLTKHDDTLSGRFAVVTIHDTKDETNKGPVYVGLNNNGYLFPRNVPCRVPVEVADILENAVETAYDASSGKEVIATLVPRFPFSRRDEAVAA